MAKPRVVSVTIIVFKKQNLRLLWIVIFFKYSNVKEKPQWKHKYKPFCPPLFPSDLFLEKAQKYFEDRNPTHIVIFLSGHLENKKKKLKEGFLRISEGVIHLNVYDSPYL